MNKTIFKGTCTAAITPFTKDGIDFNAFEKQIEYQIANQIDALCVLGTTGEAPTITDKEYEEIAKFAYDKINLEAFENDIELTGESYTVFVDQNEEEGTIVADVFMPKVNED